MDTTEIVDLVTKEEARIEVQKEVLSMRELMEWAKMLADSTIVPVTYQHRPENCFIALDMASRMGISPLVVMQSLFVIQGKPSWSGAAIGSLIMSNPKFTNVELNYVGQEGTDSWGAYVSANNRKTGKVLKGGTVTIAISKKEGWYQKSGSKWQTTPEIMLAYRAYAWFGRVYCPETLMGLQSVEEVEDVGVTEIPVIVNPFDKEVK